jgi:Protein of unknown function (DUF2442)
MKEDLVRIREVDVLDDFNVRLEFTDGTSKEIDLEPYMHGQVFEPLRHDRQAFGTVHVDRASGTIVWDNGADIDPDVLYHGLTPSWMEDSREVA